MRSSLYVAMMSVRYFAVMSTVRTQRSEEDDYLHQDEVVLIQL
jgi:hypothetical protein